MQQSPDDVSSLRDSGPWPRFWARMIDIHLPNALLGTIVALIIPSWFTSGGIFASKNGGLLFSWLLIPAAIVVDASIYLLFGTTIGKSIAGLRVVDNRGAPLSWTTYLRRSFRVYLYGLGTGFPLVSLFTLAASHKQAIKGLPQPWDEQEGTRVATTTPGYLRATCAAFAYAAIVLGGTVYSAYSDTQPAAAASSQKVVTAEAELDAAAKAVRIASPKMIDDDTRMDGAEAGPGRNFTYQYTMVKLLAEALDPAKVDEFFQGEMRDRLVAAFCWSADFEGMRKLGTTVHFQYRDRSGAVLGTVSVAPSQCVAKAPQPKQTNSL